MSSVNDPRGANFKTKVDGIVRAHRDVRDTAIEPARLLHQRNRDAKIAITDVLDRSVVEWSK
jgi:hypothetical protein